MDVGVSELVCFVSSLSLVSVACVVICGVYYAEDPKYEIPQVSDILGVLVRGSKLEPICTALYTGRLSYMF